MNIRFSTDSTCDIGADFIERFGVEIVRLRIELDGQSYIDGENIDPDMIISKVNAGSNLPKTSAINVEEYREAFSRLTQGCDALIHFTIGSDFSSCYQNACLAAQQVENVYVIDSMNLSSGIGMLIAEAWERAQAGMAPEAIVEEVNALRSKVNVSFIVDRLDYLYKGGRCSMLAMLGANVLHIRPCIEVSEGKMVVGRKFRGTYERCLRQYLAGVFKDKDTLSNHRVYITHTGLNDEALRIIREIVTGEMKFDEVFETRAGCSITSHCGENCFGVILMRK